MSAAGPSRQIARLDRIVVRRNPAGGNSEGRDGKDTFLPSPVVAHLLRS
jgi:hypothetical protein